MLRWILVPVLGLFLAGCPTARAVPAEYRVTADNTGVGFSIRYLAVAHVDGRFTDIDGSYRFDAETGDLDAIDVVVGTASIDTDSPRRDRQLRSPDFFAVDQFPSMHFQSRHAVRTGPRSGRIEGDLTLHGITRPIVLMLSQSDGSATATTSIRRSDFGMRYGVIGLFIADRVDIHIDIRQMPAP